MKFKSYVFLLLLLCSTLEEGLSQVSDKMLDSLVEVYASIERPELEEFLRNFNNTESLKDALTVCFVNIARKNIHNGSLDKSISILSLLIIQNELSLEKELQIRYLLGYCYFASRMFSKAIAEYSFVLENSHVKSTKDLCTFYLANLYFLMGEYNLGLEVLKRTENSIRNSDLLVKILNLKAQFYSKMSNEKKALSTIDRSIASCSTSTELHQGNFIKANILLSYGRNERALLLFKRSLVYKTKVSNIIKAYNNISYAYIKQESPEALKYINLSRQLLDSMFTTTYHNQFAVMFQNLAEYHAMNNDYDLALRTIDTCIYNHCYENAISGSPTDYSIELFFLEDKLSLTDFYEVKLDILHQAREAGVEGVEHRIEILYSEIDELIQSIREERFDDQNRFFQQSKLSRFYRAAYLYFVEKDDLEKAYYFLQQMKSIILLEKIQHHQAHQLLPAKEQKILESFQDSIKSLGSEQNDSIYRTADLQRIQVSYLNYRNQLKHRFPQYFEARFSEQKLDLKSSISQIKKEEMLVDYYLDTSSVHIFTISRAAGLNYEEITFSTEDRERLELLITDIRSEPSIMDWSYESMQAFQNENRLLTQKLIRPSMENAKHLIIIPHNELLYLPFEALYNAKNNCPFQVCERSFSYAYSHFLWSKLHAKKSDEDLSVMVYSPYENQNEQDFLPNARIESSIISQFFNTEIFSSLEKASFFAECENKTIHHILSHANLDEQNSSLTNVSLGPDREKIYMQDIVSNPFNSSMVVLSACNSGNGSFVQGEGVLSLARSFIESGAESIVMSGHAVPDYASSQIMTVFYEELANGASKHQALSKSKKHYIESSSQMHQHPYYWAGFVLQGNDNALIQKEIPYLAIIGLTIVAIVFISFWSKTRS